MTAVLESAHTRIGWLRGVEDALDAVRSLPGNVGRADVVAALAELYYGYEPTPKLLAALLSTRPEDGAIDQLALPLCTCKCLACQYVNGGVETGKHCGLGERERFGHCPVVITR